MVQKTMHQVKTKTPTSLTSAITQTDTRIDVADISEYLLDPAPNLVHLKSGSSLWERCRYTAVVQTTGNAGYLTIERSGEYHGSSANGSALAWGVGTKVYRGLGEGDIGPIQSNIADHESRIQAIETLDVNWSEVTATSQSLAVNKGYILNNASRITCTLPTVSAVGDVIRIVGKGAGGWKIAQNASQYIKIGNYVSTTGTGGYLQSCNPGDAVDLICDIANTSWRVSPNPVILEVI